MRVSTYNTPGSLAGLGRIEITDAEPAYAEAIRDAISANGGTASIVSAPQRSGLCVFTEGLSGSLPAERHYAALQAILTSGGHAQAVMLDRASAERWIDVGGLSGLCRSLRIERPAAHLTSLSLATRGDIHEDATRIVRSLNLSDSDFTLGVDGVYRDVPGGDIAPPSFSETPPASPVWLVTGGGRGVTADCTIEVARRSGGTFILLGRSDLVQWPEWLEAETDLKVLRGALARNKDRPDTPKTPVEIDRFARKLLAGAEIASTLAAIDAAGAKGLYVQADIGNPAGLRTILQELVEEEGAITGLIHGAGVLADGLVDRLDLKSFETVFAPKVMGLETILTCLDLQNLNHIGLFSSASAVFGNEGQANYAAANAWLNNVAENLAASLPATQVKSFCWGPWHGGMVDDALARMFAERGIGLISRNEGARIFADQLLNSPHDQVRFVVGDEWGDS